MPKNKSRVLCRIEGCGKPMNAHRLCHKHYDRWRKNGDPLDPGKVIVGDCTARFLSHVDKTPTCWLWTAATFRRGYGQFFCDGKHWVASRWIATQVYGPIPEGKEVCHTCDEPRCVRPEHLYIGTHRTNTTDRVVHGRHYEGGSHPNALLTDAQAAELRARYAAGGISQTALGAEYGITQTTVSQVVLRKTYR